MSYINAITKRNEVWVWERNDPASYPRPRRYTAEHYCYVRDDDGLYTSIYGDNLTKKTFANRADMSEYIKANKNNLFESDIPSELRALSKHYYNVPAPKLNVTFLDIEVDYDKTVGFSSIKIHMLPSMHSHYTIHTPIEW